MSKQTLIFMFFIFLFPSIIVYNIPPQNMTAEQIYDEYSRSVVEIIVEVPASPEIHNAEPKTGVGTGFFISPTEILTNDHVLQGIDKVKIKFSFSDELFDANVITTNKNADFAVISPADTKLFEKFNLKSLVLYKDRNNKNGQTVVAIGNPYGMEFSISEGILSNKNRNFYGHHGYFIQTDTSILPGNSGGPLFNMQGQVIGMNEFILGGGNPIGFSIPSEYMLKFLIDFKNETPIQYAYMGAKMKTLTSKIMVDAVDIKSPAENAGLKSGDQLTSITTKNVTNKEIIKFNDLVDELTLINKGDTFTLQVIREGELIDVIVTPNWKDWEPVKMN